MKRILSVSLAIAVSAALLVLAPISKRSIFAVHAGTGCTNATLSGDYGLTFSGFQLQSSKSVAFYGAGLGTADGAGNFAATFADSQNGALPGNRYISNTNDNYNASYTVNSNCTGLLTATPGSGGDNFSFVIVNGGAEILATDISAPDTLTLDLKKE